MQTYYHRFQRIIATVLLLASTSCESNPSHKPAIGGTIELIKNVEKELCFLPKFETAYLTSTLAFNDLKFINLSYINVSLGNDPLANKVVWEASPKYKMYYQLKEGDKICMNQKQSELAVAKHKNLDNNNEYTVVIGGMDDTKKYNLRFIKSFIYPIQSK